MGRTKDNAIHRITRESKIRSDLFIRPGDVFDRSHDHRNRRLIRSRSYISGREHPRRPRRRGLLDGRPDRHDPRSLDDRHRRRGRKVTGTPYRRSCTTTTYWVGTQVSVRPISTAKTGQYGGNLFEYENPNIMGSLLRSGRIIAGQGFDHSGLRSRDSKKEFIRPSGLRTPEHPATTAGSRSTSTRWISTVRAPGPGSGTYGAVNPAT